MAERILPDVQELRERFHYGPTSGKLFWRERPLCSFAKAAKGKIWNARFAGKEAGSKLTDYVLVRMHETSWKAHRIAWAIHTGAWPKGQIDHINGDGHDNRISNLREVSNRENHKNMPLRADNSSGHNGILQWPNGRWRAEIRINGKNKHLGMFEHLEDAIEARRVAEKQFGFHENHGRRGVIRKRRSYPSAGRTGTA